PSQRRWRTSTSDATTDRGVVTHLGVSADPAVSGDRAQVNPLGRRVGRGRRRRSTVMQERAMGKLIYASNMSLDGYTEDEQGGFDWAPPDGEVFMFITELMRSAGTYLYGRRMYETLAV